MDSVLGVEGGCETTGSKEKWARAPVTRCYERKESWVESFKLSNGKLSINTIEGIRKVCFKNTPIWILLQMYFHVHAELTDLYIYCGSEVRS